MFFFIKSDLLHRNPCKSNFIRHKSELSSKCKCVQTKVNTLHRSPPSKPPAFKHLNFGLDQSTITDKFWVAIYIGVAISHIFSINNPLYKMYHFCNELISRRFAMFACLSCTKILSFISLSTHSTFNSIELLYIVKLFYHLNLHEAFATGILTFTNYFR